MLLRIALVVFIGLNAQAWQLEDGVEGVCHAIQRIEYVENELREVEEIRREWCWSLSKGFRCDVVYKTWQTVPVTKERDQDVLVCCEGWHLVGVNCEKEEKPSENASEQTKYPPELALSYDQIDVPAGRNENHNDKLFSQPTQNESPSAMNSGADVDFNDLHMAKRLFAVSRDSSPPLFAPIVVNTVNEEEDSHGTNQGEAKPDEHFSIFDIFKSLGNKTETSTPEPSITTPPNPADEVPAASAAPAVNSEETAQNEAKAEELAAKAEEMAAEILGIFANELLKSPNDQTSPPEGEVPEAIESESTKLIDDNHVTESGSAVEHGSSATTDDDGSQRDFTPLPLSSPPVTVVPPSTRSSPRESRVIECSVSAILGFVACLIILLPIAAVAYLNYSKKTNTNCEMTAVRPVVVP